jgi:integrase/recombinase XerD
METSKLDLENLIQGFRLSCQTEGKSPRTIEWYKDFLNGFRKFLILKGFPTDLDQINRDHIRLYIAYLQNEARTRRGSKQLSPATIQGAVRTLKAFFSWALREDYVESNPMARIPVPKAVSKIVNTYTQEQITNLIGLCHGSNDSGCRNLAILLLLLDTGIRVSELVGIELSDVNLTDGYIKIRHAKGGKERLIPIGSLVQKSLWKYINSSRPKPLTQRVTTLFLGSHGMPLTRSGVQQMIRRYGKQVNIDGVRCSPHTFRHTFSKHYLLNGGDIFSLQRILGHSSLASVRNYLNLFAIDIKKQHQRFSPVDNLIEDRAIYSKLQSRITC